MLYVCHFQIGQNLTIDSDECTQGILIELYDPGDLEN